MNYPCPASIALAGCASIIAIAQAETPFPERILDEKAFNPSHFASTDIDVLLADTTRIVWYENRESAMEPWAMREISNELMPQDRANILAVADIDGDGDTDAHDLAFLLANWGPCN